MRLLPVPIREPKGGNINEDFVAIGWDVGGWQSRAQATAVARLAPGSRRVEWLGISAPFRLAEGSMLGFKAVRVSKTSKR